MRVLVNGLTAAGGRTGIGHYTAQLLRCVRQQDANAAIDCFPSPWIRQARHAWIRLRPWFERGAAPSADTRARTSPSWRQAALGRLRSAGQAILTRNLQSYCRGERYDLYHEPNFIPLPSDLPT